VLVNLRSAREYNGIVRRDIEIVVLIVAEQTSTNLFKLSLPARLLGKLNHRWLMRHYFNKSEDSAVGQLLTGYIDSWRDEFHLDLTFRVRVLGGRDVASLGIGTANALLTPADLLEAVIS